MPNPMKYTAAHQERLSLLAEECAEVIQVVMKIKRHGYESVNPFYPQYGTNREQLMSELGHVLHAIDRMVKAEDVSRDVISRCQDIKSESVGKWLHHQ